MLPILISTAAAAAIAAGFWDFGGRSPKDQRVPSRCTASLWVTSLGTRIQCGGTLSPLPTGRDSLAIGGDVQWNGLTVLLGVGPRRTVDSVMPSELAAGGLYGCTAALRNKSGEGLYSVLGIWEFWT